MAAVVGIADTVRHPNRCYTFINRRRAQGRRMCSWPRTLTPACT